MQHGRKKTPKVILTEEEKAGNKKKLENILKINAEILSLRQNKVYDLNKLEILDNMCLLSSDFYTLWNFRRDIIIHTVLNSDQTNSALQNQNYQFILKELKFLIKAIMRSPKSYTLWFHREWCIKKGIQIEKNLAFPSSDIIDTEYSLCDKMLSKDERNFHCWNYRSWLLNLYTQYYQHDQDTITNKYKYEFDYTTTLIEKNFSNYSAWFYRGKLLSFLYPSEIYPVDFDIITKELELLKGAFYTEPKDQSSWNHHTWLISQITPIQVVSASKLIYKMGESFSEVTIGFSERICEFPQTLINIKINGNNVNYSISPNKAQIISKIWKIKLEDEVHVSDIEEMKLSFELEKIKCLNFSKSLEKTKMCWKKCGDYLHLCPPSKEQEEERENSLIYKNLKSTLDGEISNIEELTELEPNLTNALEQLLTLHSVYESLLQNPLYRISTSSSHIDAMNTILKQFISFHDENSEEFIESGGNINLYNHILLKNKLLKNIYHSIHEIMNANHLQQENLRKYIEENEGKKLEELDNYFMMFVD